MIAEYIVVRQGTCKRSVTTSLGKSIALLAAYRLSRKVISILMLVSLISPKEFALAAATTNHNYYSTLANANLIAFCEQYKASYALFVIDYLVYSFLMLLAYLTIHYSRKLRQLYLSLGWFIFAQE